ncbi:hypothetical protein F511_40375 [Dorcoceras hygrometricum]|uniref:Uncharacterized protein n=1 Tax=Dorcoceras hygrometricum TaxID=472368 RepID=A0A2Z7BTB1_9LAMI|nr:hypothetical protein F511_40375 [Dorcoceras hygrometricum]
MFGAPPTGPPPGPAGPNQTSLGLNHGPHGSNEASQGRRYHDYSAGRGVDPTGGTPGGGYHGRRGLDPSGGAPGDGLDLDPCLATTDRIALAQQWVYVDATRIHDPAHIIEGVMYAEKLYTSLTLDPALEGLTNFARTEAPRRGDRNKSDHVNGGGTGRRKAAADWGVWERREASRDTASRGRIARPVYQLATQIKPLYHAQPISRWKSSVRDHRGPSAHHSSVATKNRAQTTRIAHPKAHASRRTHAQTFLKGFEVQQLRVSTSSANQLLKWVANERAKQGELSATKISKNEGWMRWKSREELSR